MNHFETFSTTADVGIRIKGRDYAALFESSVKGLNLLFFGDRAAEISAENSKPYPYEYEGDSAENVLVNLLSEIVFLFQCRGKATADIRIIEAADNNIKAELMLIETGMDAELEIKSVTYHNLKVVDLDGGKYAEIVFDI